MIGSAHSKNGSPPQRDYVVILHGLGRTKVSMKLLERQLRKAGFEPVNVDYPSTRHPIEFIAGEFLRDMLREHCPEAGAKIHFVTHSVGGIVVRYHVKNYPLPNLGRVVMLSPPNKGSELVDLLRGKFLFKASHGPIGVQLGTDANSLPLALGPVTFDLGIIAGDRPINPLLARFVEGPGDGKVSVERTKVEGMQDFLVMPHSHTFIMMREAVIRQAIHFLRQGSFDHSSVAKPSPERT